MTEHITISRELLRKVLSSMDMMLNSGEWYCAQERADALREALDAPAVEPVAWRAQSPNPPGGYVVFQQYPQKLADLGKPIEPLFTAPQAQQPPRIGSGVTVEQTLEQWEHDFNNPMTPEQQVDWVKREREFASAQAQQPALPPQAEGGAA